MDALREIIAPPSAHQMGLLWLLLGVSLVIHLAFMGGPNPHICIPANLMNAGHVAQVATDPVQAFGHDHIQIKRGHVFQLISLRGELRMGYGAAAMVDDGVVVAGADPRRSGAAGAIK